MGSKAKNSMTSLGVIGPPQAEQGSVSGIFESERESFSGSEAVQVPTALYGIFGPVSDLIGRIIAGVQHGSPGHYDFGPVRRRPRFIFGHVTL